MVGAGSNAGIFNNGQPGPLPPPLLLPNGNLPGLPGNSADNSEAQAQLNAAILQLQGLLGTGDLPQGIPAFEDDIGVDNDVSETNEDQIIDDQNIEEVDGLSFEEELAEFTVKVEQARELAAIYFEQEVNEGNAVSVTTGEQLMVEDLLDEIAAIFGDVKDPNMEYMYGGMAGIFAYEFFHDRNFNEETGRVEYKQQWSAGPAKLSFFQATMNRDPKELFFLYKSSLDFSQEINYYSAGAASHADYDWALETIEDLRLKELQTIDAKKPDGSTYTVRDIVEMVSAILGDAPDPAAPFGYQGGTGRLVQSISPYNTLTGYAEVPYDDSVSAEHFDIFVETLSYYRDVYGVEPGF